MSQPDPLDLPQPLDPHWRKHVHHYALLQQDSYRQFEIFCRENNIRFSITM